MAVTVEWYTSSGHASLDIRRFIRSLIADNAADPSGTFFVLLTISLYAKS